MTATAIMMLPGKTITAKPLWAALAVVVIFWLVTAVMAQSGPVGAMPIEEVFRVGGWVVLIIALLTIAASAVFNVLRKAALQEAVSLAATRKEKLIEKELENEKYRSRIRELEAENESLEKKNLRLQEAK